MAGVAGFRGHLERGAPFCLVRGTGARTPAGAAAGRRHSLRGDKCRADAVGKPLVRPTRFRPGGGNGNDLPVWFPRTVVPAGICPCLLSPPRESLAERLFLRGAASVECGFLCGRDARYVRVASTGRTPRMEGADLPRGTAGSSRRDCRRGRVSRFTVTGLLSAGQRAALTVFSERTPPVGGRARNHWSRSR